MDEQKKNDNQNNAENTSAPSGENRKNNKRERKFNLQVFIVTAVLIFLFIYVLSNLSTVWGLGAALLRVILPILLGGAIAFILNPLFRLFELTVFKNVKNKKIVVGLSLLLTYLAALLVILIIAWLIIPSLINSISSLVSDFDSYIERATLWINDLIVRITNRSELSEYIDADKLKSLLLGIISTSENIMEIIGSFALNIGQGLIIGVKNIILAIFISIYVLLSKERLKAQGRKLCAALFSGNTNGRIMRYVYLTNRTFSTYFIGMAIDAVLVAIITFIFMLIFGIPYAALVSVVVGITNIIPIFGPFIGAIPSFLIICIHDPIKALIFLVLILVIQQIDGNIIAPKIHGNSTGLSSLGVIISIIIMGEYFGFIGMIIGVPFVAVIVTVFTEFLEHKLELKGRPTDTASYYDAESLVDPYEHHENAWAKTFKGIKSFFIKTYSKIAKKKNK